MSPYRSGGWRGDTEEELWLSLDDALSAALTDRGLSLLIAGWVLMDARRFSFVELETASAELISALLDVP